MSVGQRGPVLLRPAFQRLDGLSKLEQDWDTYGALPLARTALDVAEAIMRKVVERHGTAVGERAAPYTLMPIADGGVSLEWRGPDAELELDIRPSGVLCYLLIEQVGNERRFEEGSELLHRQALGLVRRVIGG